ncbi:shikimate dehydrogenase [Simkania sp.]|uniref:shikimate dehydrogenase n=1 Tax=Simkania sp. TaxID=34094 RepID=UPI003B524D2B
MLVIAIQGSFDEAKKAIEEANKKGEAIELRLDLLKDLQHVSKLKSLCKLPVIFTLRKKDQGGKFEGNEQNREAKLLELLALKPDYVDLEFDVDPSFVEKVHQNFPDVAIICSSHDFDKTPADLEQKLKQMTHMRASIYKIATYANSSLDSLRMLSFILQKRREGVSLAGMCMGPHGDMTRILAPVVDSLLCYTSLSSEAETAPGQVPVDTLEEIYHFSSLNRQTKVYALIGDPVEQSIGHLAHNALFKKLKEDAVYIKILVQAQEVGAFFQAMKKLPFYGFSVTMPLKEKVGEHLDRINPEAKKIGAINTLNLKEESWEGFNTDASGALDAIEEKQKVAGKKVVILGAGGAARALAYETIERRGEVLIVNRTGEKAKKLAKQLGCEGFALDKWTKPSYDILMNTTPVGMTMKGSSLIPESALLKDAVVFDAIMHLKETPLLILAKNKGCQIVYGNEMFTRQAVKQAEIWLNRPLDPQDLLQTLDQLCRSLETS